MMKLLIVKRWLWSMMNCKRRKLGSEWKVAAQWDQRRPSGWKQYKRCNMGWSHFMTRILTFYDHDDHILWSWRSHEKAQSAMPLVVRTHGQLSFSSTMETTVDWTAWALHPSERWMVVIMMKRIKYERACPQCTMRTLESRNSSGLIAPGHISKNHQRYSKERHFFFKLSTRRKIEKIQFPWVSYSKFSILAKYASVSYTQICIWYRAILLEDASDASVPLYKYGSILHTYFPMYALCTGRKSQGVPVATRDHPKHHQTPYLGCLHQYYAFWHLLVPFWHSQGALNGPFCSQKALLFQVLNFRFDICIKSSWFLAVQTFVWDSSIPTPVTHWLTDWLTPTPFTFWH